MKFSCILSIATLAIASAAPVTSSGANDNTSWGAYEHSVAIQGAEGSMNNAKQVQDTLNRQLQADGGAHANAERMAAYITGADSQIDNSIATMGAILSPMTAGLSEAVAGVLLGPYIQSVTNGAEVFLANVIGGGMDRMNAQLYAQMTGDYSRLASFASKYNVDSSRLQSLSKQITHLTTKK